MAQHARTTAINIPSFNQNHWKFAWKAAKKHPRSQHWFYCIRSTATQPDLDPHRLTPATTRWEGKTQPTFTTHQSNGNWSEKPDSDLLRPFPLSRTDAQLTPLQLRYCSDSNKHLATLKMCVDHREKEHLWGDYGAVASLVRPIMTYSTRSPPCKQD